MQKSNTFYIFDREDWKSLNTAENFSMTDEELEALSALNDNVSLKDVREIYVPLASILDVFIKSYNKEQEQLRKLLNTPQKRAPYIIGIAGSVAVGKSTLARLLQTILAQYYKDQQVDLITTDGFLYPNEILEEKGIMNRKGFPESYDMHRLITFMGDVKSGKVKVQVPKYSHNIYDIVPGQFQMIDQPDILIVEGINTLQLPANEKIYASDFFDFSFYVDAEPENVEKWYLQRFGILVDTAFKDPTNYYNRFTDIDRVEAFDFAQSVWKEVNLRNLVDYILPTRFRADAIIHKTTDHYIDQILLRKH
ncbi:pantothenate kinase [Atopostipes suicloacalis DSM 15692]|uniref:Pantothenate kinase n=1 Tax=Atopostipes suicloacalis DSM 15692 TaxID=1121025 RepID=A0A1M4WVP7_9LACT|nr:type I pantothenate kinase [Atopostipes suicloacalis]SHE85309.1 pantothenate kinase [Atopostipes suicloacalis DSM 15692]